MPQQDISDLLSDQAALGKGWVVGIQGDSGTGRSVLAAGATVDERGPFLYMNCDLNVGHIPKFHPTARIDYAHLGLKTDATRSDREQMLTKIIRLWNFFLAGLPSPKYKEPYKGIIWDTHTALYDFVYPLLVEKQIEQKGDRKSAMNFADANSWMKSLKDGWALCRPETTMIFLLGEDPVWEKSDDGNGFVQTEKRIYDGWKPKNNAVVKQCRMFLRLYRKPVGPDRAYERSGGKVAHEKNPKLPGNALKKQVRMAELMKVSDNESFFNNRQLLSEPTWDDLLEVMAEVEESDV